MRNCPQTDTQSVYQHGLSVRDHLFQIIEYLHTGQLSGEWKLPSWLSDFKPQILQALLPINIIEEYATFHDCGKVYCLEYDEHGKRHFPDHAEKSYYVWRSVGGNPQAAELMRMDMLIHSLKAIEIDEFIQHPEAITLLLAGLAEIHSNASMFGGLQSDSFKIKWKQIDKRGKAICQKLFGGHNVVG